MASTSTALVYSESSVYRRLLVSGLQAIGFSRVLEADSERAAKKLLPCGPGEGDRTVDVIVIHWEVGHADAVPLLPWLREHPACRAIPALVVSDRAHMEDVVRADRVGADGYVLTPINHEILKQKIGAAARTRQARLERGGLAEGSSPLHLRELAEGMAGGPPAQVAEDHPKKPSVLVVEDEESTRSLIDYCLRAEYEVVLTSTLAEALKAIVGRRFDAVVIDINLGGDSGLDLLAVLKAMPAYKDVPAIACTAFTQASDRERLLEIGFDAYLSKPLRRQVLLETLAGARQAA